MANEQKQQQPAQAQGQNRPAQAYNHNHPWEYLLARNWVCIGMPEWADSLWLDPTKPALDTWEEQPRHYTTAEQTGTGPDGKPTYRPVRKQVMAQDGSGSSQLVRPVTQWCFTGKAEPLDLRSAIRIQMERDAKAAAQKVA